MNIKGIIRICVTYIILIAYIVSTLPTFGDEFVHIKVHIPETKGKANSARVARKPAITNRKIVHHYHSRPKPTKKIPIKESIPALENYYLSELDKHFNTNNHHTEHGGHQDIEDTYLVKELQDHPYHHLGKPKAKINTYKIIEEYDHDRHLNYMEQGKTPIEAVKFIETSTGNCQHQYHQNEKAPIDAVKLIESSDNHNQHSYQSESYNPLEQYHQASVETTKLLESPDMHHDNLYPFHNHNKNSHTHVFDKEELPKSNSQSNNYIHHQKLTEEEHIYHKPQVDALDIVDCIATIPKNYHKNHRTKDHSLVDEIIEETVDMFANTKHKNHNYEASAFQHQQPQEDITALPNYETTSKTYQYKPQHEISIDEHIKYKKPQSHVQTKFDSTHSEHSSVPLEKKFAINQRKYLPSSTTSQDFEQSEAANQSVSNDKEDLSHAVENPNGPETYTGYDSYSAGHVQGLNS